jgi:hypothetical protein
MAIRAVAGNRTTFSTKEMCHEEIHRRSRVDLADCDPDAHPDCKRSPHVAGELLVRKQRLLTTSPASERFCLRLDRTCIRKPRLAFARRPPGAIIESLREWTRSMRRMTRTRSYSHEASFCNCVSSGLRRRIHAELCTRRRWARIWSWRACTKSDHTVGSIPAAQRHFPKPHSGAAPGTFAGTRHQRAVGAKPVWRRYVSASAGQSSSDCAELLAARRCVGGSACVT